MKYRVIGGYHDGEWHPCEHEATKIAEYAEIKPTADKEPLTAYVETKLIHIYHKHEYRFCDPTYFGHDVTISVLTPPHIDIAGAFRNLIDGYVPKKERES